MEISSDVRVVLESPGGAYNKNPSMNAIVFCDLADKLFSTSSRNSEIRVSSTPLSPFSFKSSLLERRGGKRPFSRT